jgi:hypothetical protein
MAALVVAQNRLDETNVRTLIQEMRSKAMPQRMQGDALLDTRRLASLVEKAVELARCQRLATLASGENQALQRRHTGIGPRWPLLPPLPQQVQHFIWQHDMPVLPAFRLHDPDNALRTVDVAGPEPHDFAGAKPAAIAKRQHKPKLEALRAGHGNQPLCLLLA